MLSVATGRRVYRLVVCDTIERIVNNDRWCHTRSRTDAIFDTRRNWQSTQHETHVTTPPPHHPPPFTRPKTRAIRIILQIQTVRYDSHSKTMVHVSVGAYNSLAHWIVPFVRKTQSIIDGSWTAHSCDTDDCHGRLSRKLRVGPVATAGVLNRIMAYRPAPFFPLYNSAHAPLIDDTLSTERKTNLSYELKKTDMCDINHLIGQYYEITTISTK